VEYDAVLPHQILATGMTKPVAGLFLAGQINGTSGYEEAAAQGLVAGVNAAHLVLGRPPWLLGRDEAYIGVLMDDLVTKTPVEPYRMFTSRAEHRLLLRADNAADRLTPTAEGLGLLTGAHGSRRRAHFQERRRSIEALESAIAAGRHAGEPLARWLKRPEFSAEDLALALGGADRAALATVYADHRYADYVDRQRHQIRRQHEMEHRRLPALNFREIPGLRSEAAEALARFAPATFGQAGRLEGITPADLTLLAVHVQRRRDGGGSAA
jgi:tRNA uridine 5-carboxymethylaminomethyl modification enzyme